MELTRIVGGGKILCGNDQQATVSVLGRLVLVGK
jgi:hypothetical protein